jgi:O-antigen/teichoic acid export membrane protein
MSSPDADDFSAIRGALGSIGLSAIIVLGGSVLSQAMGLGTRIVMTRFLPVDGYGDIVLGITVLNLLGIVSIVGLGQAQTRYLPQAESAEERTRIAATIYQIGIGLSIVWALVGFFGAEFIVGRVFDSPGMANIVRIFALTLPFYVFYKLSLKGIQGHKKTTPNILTRNVVHPFTRLGAVAVLAFAGFGTVGLAIGYNLAFVIGGLVAFLLFIRVGGHRIRSLLIPSSGGRYRELLGFSIPLAVSASFGLVTKNSDRFLLGVFDTSSAVGVYDVAFLVSQFILFFGPVLNYLFQPIMAEYDAEDDYQHMNKLYTIVTRWLVILTFPIFSLLFLFPETLLGTFFGSEYQAGGFALALLAIGFYAAGFVGLSGSFLTATGDTKVLMYISAATAALNLGLNVAFIPVFGIVGAAIATVGSTILNNLLQSLYIYISTEIHPFTRELVVPTALAGLCVAGTEIFLDSVPTTFVQGLTVSAMLGVVFLLCIAATRSVYMIELQLADSLLERFGVDWDLENRLELVVSDRGS